MYFWCWLQQLQIGNDTIIHSISYCNFDIESSDFFLSMAEHGVSQRKKALYITVAS